MLISFFARHPCVYVAFTGFFYLSAPFFNLSTGLVIAGLVTALRWRLTPQVMEAVSDETVSCIERRARAVRAKRALSQTQ